MDTNKNMQLLQVLQSRVGSADYSRWSLIRWQWYDYVRLSAAVQTQLDFFVNSHGSQDPVSGTAKTIELTNVNKSRSFGQSFFLLEAIRTHVNFLPKGLQPAGINDDADLLLSTIRDWTAQFIQLSESGVLNVEFGSKRYFSVPKPFQFAPPGFGLNLGEHGAVTTFSSIAQMGSCPKDIYQISPIQMIEPEANVDVNIRFPDGSPLTLALNGAVPAVNIGVIFDGYIARPLQ